MPRVTTGARLHFGFVNLSLARPQLYGGLGLALAEPRVTVEAAPADGVEAPPQVATFAERAVALLEVPGAEVRLVEQFPRHVGLGSGTQLALATLTAIASAHGLAANSRRRAPDLGRGGRSGIGVATFEDGGFVLDGGHPTDLFTTGRPADGEWTVPPVAARHAIPDDWRFLLVRPSIEIGRNGGGEEASIRAVVEAADPEVADDVARIAVQQLLPAIARGDGAAFGAAAGRINRLNGSWYVDEQEGVYRPPVGAVVERLSEAPAVFGAGQSSWGPTVWGVTTASQAEAATTAGHDALKTAGVDGDVSVVAGRNSGATVEE
ncbi:MAG: beta-ribofuranosylaminobenzene 5'-phosphate synthase family protein [Halobacteriales archaeon]